MGGKCVIDAAFLRVPCPYLMKSGKKCTEDSNLLVNWVKEQATSLHQAAEWGMRALQGSFPRLKDRLVFLDELTDQNFFKILS
jgi:hypothetical protein